jgi:hypothetical protein
VGSVKLKRVTAHYNSLCAGIDKYVSAVGLKVWTSRRERAGVFTLTFVDNRRRDVELNRGGRIDEEPRIGMRRRRHQYTRLTSLNDSSAVHHERVACHVTHNREIVRDEHECQMMAFLQCDQEVDDLGLDGDVEGGGWFVGHNHRWLARERSGNSDSLALASAQLPRSPLDRATPKSRLGEQLGRSAVRRSSRSACPVPDDLGNRLSCGHPWVESADGILEDHLDVAPPLVPSAHLPPRRPLDAYLAARRFERSDQNVCERRFSAAALADDADRGAGGNNDVGVDDGGASHAAKPDLDVVCLEQRRHCCAPGA